jgi:hypothetical protein
MFRMKLFSLNLYFQLILSQKPTPYTEEIRFLNRTAIMYKNYAFNKDVILLFSSHENVAGGYGARKGPRII